MPLLYYAKIRNTFSIYLPGGGDYLAISSRLTYDFLLDAERLHKSQDV